MEIFKEISPHLFAAISPRAKRLALRLDSKRGRMNLVIPRRVSLRMAYQFAFEHKGWIEEKIKLIPPKIAYTNGLQFSYMGRDVTLKIETSEKFIRTRISETENQILIQTALEDITPRLKRYFKKRAHEEFLKLAEIKAAQIGCTVKNLSIKEMHTRWGSCSTNGMMSLSSRLIFAPSIAIDYVIAHEVAHLKFPHHKQTFWDCCKKLSTDFETGHNWMKKNGEALMKYA